MLKCAPGRRPLNDRGPQPKTAPIPKGKKMKVIRLEAVRAGFKQCWQDRDYRTIIAVARRIPENVVQEDPKPLMWCDQALAGSADGQVVLGPVTRSLDALASRLTPCPTAIRPLS